MKPVSLTVHKNTLRKRRARRLCDDIRQCAKRAAEDYGDRLTGYAVVLWTGNEGKAYWDQGDLGGVFVEDHVSTILRRQVGMRDARRLIEPEDDAG